MDGSRFDRLTRVLAGEGSRRSVMKAALGVAAGGAVTVALADGSDAAARKRNIGEVCRKDGDCATNYCGPKDRYGRQRCDYPCPNAYLAGDANGGAVCVDDTITVSVNGQQIFQSGPTASCPGQISLGSLNNGDQIQAVANNGSEDNFACGHESLTPLYLICGNGRVQTLDAVGVPDNGQDHPCDEVYYNQTFTVAV